MSNVTQPRLHHLAITVTDLDASLALVRSPSSTSTRVGRPSPRRCRQDPRRSRTGSSCSPCTVTTPTTISTSPKPRPDSTTPASPSPPDADLELWQAHLESNGVMRAELADQAADRVAHR